MDKFVAFHGEGKFNFFSFSSYVSFKQTNEHILLQVQPLKWLNTTFFVAYFRVTGKIC